MSIETTVSRSRSAAARSRRDAAGGRLVTRVRSIVCPDILAAPAICRWLPQVAWVDSRTGERWIGLGEADQVIAEHAQAAWEAADTCRERLGRVAVPPGAGSLLRYFGGIAFDPTSPGHPEWPAGLPARFVLPRLILHQREGERTARLAVTRPAGDNRSEAADETLLEGMIERLQGGTAGTASTELPRLESIEVEGLRERWVGSVGHALEAIEAGEIRKVVLSRDLVLEAGEPVDPWSLFRRIVEPHPAGLQFCFRFDRESAFLGATPERLIAQRGVALSCDCLAGTASRGATREENERLARELLASEKNRREHRFVLEGILAALRPLARWLEHPTAPTVLVLPRLQHLSSPVRGALRDGTRLGELIERLHPTPAVGGSPREAAFRLIRELEGRPRGWYAGVIGWVAEEEADLAVGIRSAIVRGRRATVIGGAGIVQGSDPAAEWEETGRKAASFLSLFTEG